MLILFGNNAVKKQCKNPLGKLLRRLDDIRAAANMAELKTLPGRLHPLVADRKGQWAMDLEHPKRLLLEPILDKGQTEKDGRLDLGEIVGVRLIGVVDYHGK